MPFLAPVAGAIAGGISAFGSFIGGLGIFGKALVSIGLNLAVSALGRALSPKQKPISGVELDVQFGESEDFALYPRDLARDSALCERSGADIVFAPTVEEMYPRPMETVVSVEPLGSDLIGAVRPGHFRGVATVVTKLFNIVGPHRAYFGEKDFQQLTIIRRMVEDLASPVRIVGVATVREEDGLAMSSRNIRLSPEDRLAARVLSQALDLGAAMIESGEGDVGTIVSAMRELIGREPRADLASLDIRSVDGLGPIETIGQERVVMLITARFGKVLLIDQREAAGQALGQARVDVRFHLV